MDVWSSKDPIATEPKKACFAYPLTYIQNAIVC